MYSDLQTKRLSARLSRIEGQVRGIKRMLETDSSCSEVMIQIAAVKSAIQKVGMILFEQNARECLGAAHYPEQEEHLDEVVKMLGIILK